MRSEEMMDAVRGTDRVGVFVASLRGWMVEES